MPKTVFVRKPCTFSDVIVGDAWIKALRDGKPHDDYYIAQEIHLSDADWNDLLSNLLADRDWIAEFSRQDHMPKGEAVACIRVTADCAELALLIDTQGYNYARYVGIEDT